jgi:hypothetical protein
VCDVFAQGGKVYLIKLLCVFMCAKVARCSWELKGHISFTCVTRIACLHYYYLKESY